VKVLARYSALLQEWFRPSQVGAYFDGEEFFLAEDPRHPGRRPARVFIALSHRLLYFHSFKLPRELDPQAKYAAARLEAKRVFSLLKGRAPEDIECAFFERRPGEVVVAFQEKTFFEELLARLPKGLVPCGVVPAASAVIAYFLKKSGNLSEGLYYLRTEKAYEGVITLSDRPKGFLPSSSGAARSFLESFEGEIFTEEGEAQGYLAEGARLLSRLPESFLITFERYPLKPRPGLSFSVATFWALPLCLFLLGQGMHLGANHLGSRVEEIRAKLQKLKKSLSEIEEFQQKEETYSKVQQTLKEWKEKKIDLIEVIVRLSEIFPDHTWVRKLEYRAPDEIRLWAEGQNALEILKLLDKEPLFEEVKFQTSVTKNTRTGKEVFSLVAKVKPLTSSE